MDKLEEMKSTIKENLKFSKGKVYYSPEISDEIKTLIAKYFDENLEKNNIIAFYDGTSSSKCKEGMVFMPYGVYYLEKRTKPYYFNYNDIIDIILTPDKKGNIVSTEALIEIKFNNDETLSLNKNDLYKWDLKKLLLELKKQFTSWDDILYISKTTGKCEKIYLTKEQKKKCNAIIHSASAAAGAVGTGFAQIPLSDNALITPIQIGMITSLGSVFDIRVTESIAKGIIAGASASFIGRSATQLLIGWIPGLGNAINTATATGLTEAIGWVAVAHFCEASIAEKAKYHNEGKKEGYNSASKEYEKKLKEQADSFMKQKELTEEQFKKLETLLKKYENYFNESDRYYNNPTVVSEEKNKKGTFELSTSLLNNSRLKEIEEMKLQYTALFNIKDNFSKKHDM